MNVDIFGAGSMLMTFEKMRDRSAAFIKPNKRTER